VVERSSYNRREYPRYEIEGVQGSLDQHPAELILISLSGLLAASKLRPEPEKTVHVEFPLGEGIFQSAARVAFVGPDLWRGEAGWSRVGLQFTGMPKRSQALLSAFLEGRKPMELVGS
jgi:PilZ domain